MNIPMVVRIRQPDLIITIHESRLAPALLTDEWKIFKSENDEQVDCLPIETTPSNAATIHANPVATFYRHRTTITTSYPTIPRTH